MHTDLDDRLKIALPEASELLAKVPEPFAVLFKRGDLSVGTAARLGVVTLSGAGRRDAWRRQGLFRVGHRPAPASLPIGSSPTMLRPPILRQSHRRRRRAAALTGASTAPGSIRSGLLP